MGPQARGGIFFPERLSSVSPSAAGVPSLQGMIGDRWSREQKRFGGRGGLSGSLIHTSSIVPDVRLAKFLHLALRPSGLFQQPGGTEGKWCWRPGPKQPRVKRHFGCALSYRPFREALGSPKDVLTSYRWFEWPGSSSSPSSLS